MCVCVLGGMPKTENISIITFVLKIKITTVNMLLDCLFISICFFSLSCLGSKLLILWPLGDSIVRRKPNTDRATLHKVEMASAVYTCFVFSNTWGNYQAVFLPPAASLTTRYLLFGAEQIGQKERFCWTHMGANSTVLAHINQLVKKLKRVDVLI